MIGDPKTVIKGGDFDYQSTHPSIIVDIRKNIHNFACNSVLEFIYENEDFSYYLNCIKSDYILVTYDNDSQQNIIEALNDNKIMIDDLDTFQIEYIKEAK